MTSDVEAVAVFSHSLHTCFHDRPHSHSSLIQHFNTHSNTCAHTLTYTSHTTPTHIHTPSSELAGVDIVVGTPARLCSLAESKTLILSQIRFYVLDEADALVTGDHYVPVSTDPGPYIPDI
jgi:DEAD/DEAH box helicase